MTDTELAALCDVLAWDDSTGPDAYAWTFEHPVAVLSGTTIDWARKMLPATSAQSV